MKYSISHICSLVIASMSLSHFALAADNSTCAKMDPEMMKKCAAACTPGPSHKSLQPIIGNWNAEVQCWMPGSNKPTVSKATATSSWILNGHFIQEKFNGQFMGKPFHGISISGYDNVKRKYTNLWIDDMHTSMFVSEGSAQKNGTVITFNGKMDCPVNGKDTPVKQVVRILSPDKHVFEMYVSMKGHFTKTMEITYTRK